MPLFGTTLPSAPLYRLWDCLLLEGECAHPLPSPPPPDQLDAH